MNKEKCRKMSRKGMACLVTNDWLMLLPKTLPGCHRTAGNGVAVDDVPSLIGSALGTLRLLFLLDFPRSSWTLCTFSVWR